MIVPLSTRCDINREWISSARLLPSSCKLKFYFWIIMNMYMLTKLTTHCESVVETPDTSLETYFWKFELKMLEKTSRRWFWNKTLTINMCVLSKWGHIAFHLPLKEPTNTLNKFWCGLMNIVWISWFDCVQT